MTTSVSYLSGAVDEVYGTQALGYISGLQLAINAAASNIGISASAIGGAMAEEAAAYYGRKAIDDFLDQYALSGIDPETAAASLAVALAAGPLGMAVWASYYAIELATTTRTHAEWVADYAVVDGDVNPDALDKLAHPVLMDVGAANFKIYTAITLVRQYAHDYPDLGLTPYLNDYNALVEDLVNQEDDLTAKLYGLYLKEADDWYKSKLAYGRKMGSESIFQ
ncbi:MAG: hypothetical protein U1E13_05415 [Methylophilaceae bacterium]|nr:hypothetical protein [Methylophilaceae bacterium]